MATNKGNGKGPILGLNNKPISESDRVKYKAVDDKQTKMLKASNTPKKVAAKPVAKAPVKKVAPKSAAPAAKKYVPRKAK